jgi:hypothetical protein
MASEKKPFWKKALRVFAYGVGAAAIAAGVMVAIAATHGAAAPFLHIAWLGIIGHPAIAAGAAAGATALGLAGVGAFIASRSNRGQERKKARAIKKAMKLARAQGYHPGNGYAQGLEHQMVPPPYHLVAHDTPPAYLLAQAPHDMAAIKVKAPLQNFAAYSMYGGHPRTASPPPAYHRPEFTSPAVGFSR